METNLALKPNPLAGFNNQLHKNAPEILVGIGVVGVIASTVLACKATLRAPETLEIAKDKFAAIAEATENGEDYTEDDRKKDLMIATTQTAVDFLKLYGIPAVLMTVSLFSIGKGHGITMERNAALTSAFTAVSLGYKTYRERVRDHFGEDVENDLYYGRTIEKQEVEVEGKDGKMKTVKEDVMVFEVDNKPSVYARWFDEHSTEFQTTAELNLTFLRQTQRHCNDKLYLNKVLFLNEVYDMLGLPRSAEGQVVGWAYDPAENANSYVDFGIYLNDDTDHRAFVNGRKETVLLDFNVEGVVWELLS